MKSCIKEGRARLAPVRLFPLKTGQGLPLRGLLGNHILQIVEDFFAGLHRLINLLGVFIAHKYADTKDHNE
jgi:hypothetical protein